MNQVPDRAQTLAQSFLANRSASPSESASWGPVLKFLQTSQGNKLVRAAVEHAIRVGQQNPNLGQQTSSAILSMLKSAVAVPQDSGAPLTSSQQPETSFAPPPQSGIMQ